MIFTGGPEKLPLVINHYDLIRKLARMGQLRTSDEGNSV